MYEVVAGGNEFFGCKDAGFAKLRLLETGIMHTFISFEYLGLIITTNLQDWRQKFGYS